MVFFNKVIIMELIFNLFDCDTFRIVSRYFFFVEKSNLFVTPQHNNKCHVIIIITIYTLLFLYQLHIIPMQSNTICIIIGKKKL
jgi:hypothetical protein